jgi:hypothetical protein
MATLSSETSTSGGGGVIDEKAETSHPIDPKRIELKKWNAVALWSWDIEVDTCTYIIKCLCVCVCVLMCYNHSSLLLS